MYPLAVLEESSYEETPIHLVLRRTALPSRPPQETVDAETAVLRLTPSALEDHSTYDAATVTLTLTASAIELHAHACFAGTGVAELNWTGTADYRWEADANMRWEAFAHNTAGWC